jgi:uncharacterized protein (DUF1501 family)
MNLSHFRATDIMFSGSSSDDVVSTGWLARWLEAVNPGFPSTLPSDPMALQQGFSAGLVLQGDRGVTGVVVENPSTFYSLVNTNYTGEYNDSPANGRGAEELEYVRDIDEQSFQYAAVIQAAATAGLNRVTYPNTRLGSQLATVAKLIDGQMATQVYITARSGFDTHANQAGAHNTLLSELAGAATAFMDDLAAMGRQDDVIILTVSEFGRRPSENGSSGSDHGTSAPWLVIGNGVVGGLIGNPPDLSNLDTAGNLQVQADYRSVYGSILQGWMGADSAIAQQVLMGTFPLLPLFSASAVPDAGPIGPVHLFAPTPNPGRGPRTLRFQLERPGPASLSAYDVGGRRVAVLQEGYLPAGPHEVVWNPPSLTSGMYVIVLDAGGLRHTQKLVVR